MFMLRVRRYTILPNVINPFIVDFIRHFRVDTLAKRVLRDKLSQVYIIFGDAYCLVLMERFILGFRGIFIFLLH